MESTKLSNLQFTFTSFVFLEWLSKGWSWLIELTVSKMDNGRKKENHVAYNTAIEGKRKLGPCGRDT